jgi:membrane protein DedA with SNARE-associated domain
MHTIIETLSGYIIQFIEATSYFGIFILMMLESALIPIPSEITMPFSGYLVSQDELNFILVVLVGAFANLVGSWIAYYIGYFLEETVIINWVKKYGKYILFTVNDYQKATKWFLKYGNSIVFFSRLLPGIRTFISLPAGIAKMNIVKFSIYTFLGSLIWCTVLTYIGYYFGENWKALEPIYRKFEFAIVAVAIIFAFWYINHKLKLVKLPKIKH